MADTGSSGVQIRTLPVGILPIPDAGGRLISPAGEMAQVGLNWHIRFLVCLELLPGGPETVRGNHVHDKRLEHFYVMSGHLIGAFRAPGDTEVWTRELAAGDFVTVQPGCAHAYRALSPSYAIEFAENEYDPDDTRRIPLITT